MLHEHAFDKASGRRLFSLAISGPDDLPRLELPEGNFACLVALDARHVSDQKVIELATSLLRAGACYFVCWGADCERVHDLVDAVVCDHENPADTAPGAIIMTTWHDTDSLEEALWYFLRLTRPDEHYRDSTHSALALAIGSSAWAEVIAGALREPREFVARELGNGVV